MELILVRHGEPAWTTPDGTGRNDPWLTERGTAQARLIAERMADRDTEPARGPVDRLFVSPAVRAQETAAPIAEALAMAAETRDWLWELRNPPEWEGAPIDDIDAAFAEIRGRSLAEMWEGLPGGEPIADFHERIITGLTAQLADLGVTRAEQAGLWDVAPEAPERVVAVAHAGTNSTVIAHLLGIAPEPWEWDRFTMGHASVAVLGLTPLAGAHLWSLRALGDANHLPVDSRTR